MRRWLDAAVKCVALDAHGVCEQKWRDNLPWAQTASEWPSEAKECPVASQTRSLPKTCSPGPSGPFSRLTEERLPLFPGTEADGSHRSFNQAETAQGGGSGVLRPMRHTRPGSNSKGLPRASLTEWVHATVQDSGTVRRPVGKALIR